MLGPTTIVVSVILIAIALAAILAFRPSITVTRGGKILAFLAFFLFPVLAGWTGYSEHMERSKKTAFCLSCHEMEDYGKSLRVDDPTFLAANHFQNNRVPRDKACFTCHTDYTLYGDYQAKLRGLRHVYVHYLGTVPQEIKLYTPYHNRECLHCHAGARNFEEGATHNQEEGFLDRIKLNQISCRSSDCHGVVHNVKELGNATFWDPAKKTTTEPGEAEAESSSGENKRTNENTGHEKDANIENSNGRGGSK